MLLKLLRRSTAVMSSANGPFVFRSDHGITDSQLRSPKVENRHNFKLKALKDIGKQYD